MSALLDTNVVVRYLTGDPPDQADKAAKLIEGDNGLLLTDVVIAEVVYVLHSRYNTPREAIIDSLVELLSRESIGVLCLDKALVVHALLLCRPSNRVGIPDALVWAAARSSGVHVVYSFDGKFQEDGVEVRRSF
ncbi:MAG: PIN domain-containing protein [Chloroflexi bacterium]|nr:PIN domain-containing protein [Chloroflexota bacterium]